MYDWKSSFENNIMIRILTFSDPFMISQDLKSSVDFTTGTQLKMGRCYMRNPGGIGKYLFASKLGHYTAFVGKVGRRYAWRNFLDSTKKENVGLTG